MSFEIVETTDRADWLKARRQGVGASDIAAIMEISPWATPFQVWASKVAELPEDDSDEAMLMGRAIEGFILDQWEERNGRQVTDRGILIRSTKNPILMATPDGLTTTPEGAPAVAEAKNRAEWRWTEIPDCYRAQVQWQLAVTGYEVGYLIVLFAGRHLEAYEIVADAEYQAEMIEAASNFWKLVEADEPPPVEADDNALMASLWPTHIERPIEIDAGLARELYEARRLAKAAVGRKDAAEAAVKAVMGDADTAVVGQQVVATWRDNGKGRRFLVKGEGLDD